MNKALSIFISFSSKEMKAMLQVNSFIESQGHTTYYAPRDIPVGTAYPNAIIELINKADVFLLIFTESSQNSIWVQKELERAISKNKFVIPMRLQNVPLNGYMEFLISNMQWIDHDPNFEPSVDRFGKYLNTLSEKLGKELGPKMEAVEKPHATQTTQAAPQPTVQSTTDSDNLYQQGMDMLAEKNYHEAYLFLLQAANDDNSNAQNELGFLYQEGRGVNKNYEAALKWYSKSAEQGNTEAIKNKARMHHLGMGMEPDYEKAFLLYSQAARLGNAHAISNIGNLFHEGKGVQQDYAKAMEWYLKAADKDFSIAISNIAFMYKLGEGVEQSYEQAMQWFLKAANQNNANAQFQIGYLFDLGQGVKQDDEKALEWYLKAANQNNVNALHNIGGLYSAGQGVQKNEEKALEWFLKAADQNNGNSQIRAASMYALGLGTAVDHQRAFEWFDRAVENNGIDDVTETVVICYVEIVEKGLKEGKDTTTLLKWLAKAEAFLDKSTLLDIETFREYADYAKLYRLKVEVCIAQDNFNLAEKAYVEIQDKFMAIYKRYEFDFYLGFCFWSAARSYGEYLLNQKKYEKALPILKYASENGLKESTKLLSKMYKEGLGVEINEAYANELGEKAEKHGLKKFTIPCDYNGVERPTDIYVRDSPADYPYEGVEDQEIWLGKARNAKIPVDVRDTFKKIHKIAREHKVFFPALCMRALGEDKKE